MTYNEQASSLWVDAARGLSAYLSDFSFTRKVRICSCMDASSEVIQHFQLFSGDTRLKPSFLALGLLLIKPTVAKQSQNSSFLCPKCTGFFCVYSYFEKGCGKKCTRESRKVLWVVLSSLFLKGIWKNGTRGHGRMFESAKGKQQK